MEIEIRLFAHFRQYLPHASDSKKAMVPLKGHWMAKEVLAKLGIPSELPKVILINGVQGSLETQLHTGDTLTVIPPIAGGGKTMVISRSLLKEVSG